jgi:hypothetical protein
MLGIIANFVGRSSKILSDINNIPSIGDLCNTLFLNSNSNDNSSGNEIGCGQRLNDWMIVLHMLFSTLSVLSDISEEVFIVILSNALQSDYVFPVLLVSSAHQSAAIALLNKFLTNAIYFMELQRSEVATQKQPQRISYVEYIGNILGFFLMAVHLLPNDVPSVLLLGILHAILSVVKVSSIVQDVFVELNGIETLFFIMSNLKKLLCESTSSAEEQESSKNDLLYPILSIFLMCLRCLAAVISHNARNKVFFRDGNGFVPRLIQILVSVGLLEDRYDFFVEFSCLLFTLFFLSFRLICIPVLLIHFSCQSFMPSYNRNAF